MTRYAIDRARNVLTAQWSTGMGDTAITVTPLPRATPREDLLRLAASLTDLSQTCWRCYTHPATAAQHHGRGSLGWHRQQERDAFSTVLPTLITSGPSAPEPGTTRVSRAAHAVGQALHTIDATQLTTLVTTDVAAELAAIEQAERGDLSERAEQAVTLSREDASPLQISQADTLLRQHPFGCPALHTQIDPTAAAIAAAHWLHAAVTITARRTGMHPAHVVAAADNGAKPLAIECLGDVIGLMATGSRPRHAVMALVRNALHIAEGRLLGIDDARQRVAAAEQLIAKARTEHPGHDFDPDNIHLPLTSLDPAQPAPDLLENLLYGIRTCWRLYDRHVSARSQSAGDDVAGERRQEELLETFFNAVRREACARSDHLL